MMIKNAKIKNVAVGYDERKNFAVKMTFEGDQLKNTCGFVLTDSVDVQRLLKLMDYTNTIDVNELCDKSIRIVLNKNGFIRGFGDINENKFIPSFGNELMEVTESKIREITD